MQGSIQQRNKGSWTIRLDAGVNPTTGKRRQIRQTVRGTKKDAEQKLRELLHQIDTGIALTNNRLRVGEYHTSWLADVVAIRNTPRTSQTYTAFLSNHVVPHVGAIELRNLQPGHVQQMEADLLKAGLSKTSVLFVHTILSKSLKDALRLGLVHRNVTQAIVPPNPGRYEVKVPELEDITRILELAHETRYSVAFHFMAFTGVRRGECLGLRWSTVDLEHGLVSIVEGAQYIKGRGVVCQPTKSSVGRRGISLDPSTVEMLRAHQGEQLLHRIAMTGVYEDNNLVFPGTRGRILDPSVLTQVFKRLATKAGVPELRLHDLRHSHAAGLVRANVHPTVIQQRLGHASVAFSLNTYGHVTAGLQEEAAKAFSTLMKEASLKSL